MPEIKNVVVAVTGGIAAYKACELTSRLKKAGYEVRCIMTEHAQKFVTPLTLENFVRCSRWSQIFLSVQGSGMLSISLWPNGLMLW